MLFLFTFLHNKFQTFQMNSWCSEMVLRGEYFFTSQKSFYTAFGSVDTDTVNHVELVCLLGIVVAKTLRHDFSDVHTCLIWIYQLASGFLLTFYFFITDTCFARVELHQECQV